MTYHFKVNESFDLTDKSPTIWIYISDFYYFKVNNMTYHFKVNGDLKLVYSKDI